MKFGKLKRKAVTLLTAAVLAVTALVPGINAKAASQSVEEGQTISVPEPWTFIGDDNELTVNGTLTGTGSRTIIVEKGASLVIKGTGTITNTKDEGITLYVEEGASCNIRGGVKIKKDSSVNGYVIENHGTMNISDAEITHNNSNTHSSNVKNLGSLTVSGAIIHGGVAAIKNDWNSASEKGTLTINSGNFEGTVCAVQNYGAATINNGFYTGHKDGCIANGGDSSDPDAGKVTINGGNFEGTSVFGTQAELASDAKLAENIINDGTFNAPVANQDFDLGKVAISGGEFLASDTDYIIKHSVAEKTVTKLSNGMVVLGTVEPDEPSKTVTKPAKAESKPHVHNMEWVVINEATEDKDGEIQYRCSDCGYVEYRQPLSSFAVFNYNVAKQISNAPANGTVTVDAAKRQWISYSPAVLITLRDRKDVTLVTDYLYKGTKYELTIPAGADLTPLGDLDSLNPGQCFGYLYLGQYFQNAAK